MVSLLPQVLLLLFFFLSPARTSGGRLSLDQADLVRATADFGNLVHDQPSAVYFPAGAVDLAELVASSYRVESPFGVGARGHGHSIAGQAQAAGGVVVEMASGSWDPPNVGVTGSGLPYVDARGGELWVDVLGATLEHGLAPRSWTDYLHLTVGGTLSNAGISGQAFQHGPQISNVFELDVVTGKGELVTCSEEQNSELFFSVLGGLGQFGIITRARIAVETAPQRVRWIRVLYSDFSDFTKDQEYLISLHGQATKFDYVEGFVIVDEGLINNWRSSFFSPRNPVKISSLGNKGGVLYCLEMTKNYDESSADTIDQEIESLLKRMDFIPVSVFTTDVSYVEFLDRVHKAELKMRAKGLWDVPHPWLNLFVPASRIADFDAGVFKGILANKTTSGPILIYPMNKHKWDERTSVVIPEEGETFYLVALLRSALDLGDEAQALEFLSAQNEEVLRFCEVRAIPAKQYLPSYADTADWKRHFGDKWDRFVRRKAAFDPKAILSPGQRIFRPGSSLLSDS
ncbi:unnamed protein product [Victoria cruziana]